MAIAYCVTLDRLFWDWEVDESSICNCNSGTHFLSSSRSPRPSFLGGLATQQVQDNQVEPSQQRPATPENKVSINGVVPWMQEHAAGGKKPAPASVCALQCEKACAILLRERGGLGVVLEESSSR